MTKVRPLIVVAIATLFVALSLSFPALAKPSCTCTDVEVTRTGSITYTVVISASEDSLWYDVVESVSETVVAGPSSSNVLTDVVLQVGYTYYARVADSEDGPYYSYPECAITLSPTTVEITSLTASSNPAIPVTIAIVVVAVMAMAVVTRRR